MKKLLVLALALGAAAEAVLAQAPEEKEAVPQESSASAFAKLNAKFVAAANAKDAAKMASVYTDNAVLMPPNGAIVRGRDNIKGFWQGMLDQGARDVSVTSLGSSSSGAVGYEAGTYAFTMQPAGGQPTRDKGKYLVGFKRRSDGKWLIAYDIFNSDLPCPPPPPKK